MSKIWFIFILIKTISSYDFIRDALNSIDQTADPCDDFYRHACPVGDYGHLIQLKYDQMFEDLNSHRKDSPWEKLIYKTKLDNIRLAEEKESTADTIADIFSELCDENSPLLVSFLRKVQQMAEKVESDYCYHHCLLHYEKDHNCTRIAAIVREQAQYIQTVPQYINGLKYATDVHMLGQIYANTMIDGYRGGISVINSYISEIIETLTSWIENTPWVNNQNVTESIEAIAKELYLEDNFGSQLRDSFDFLMKIEQRFMKCSIELQGKYGLFCLMYTSQFSKSTYRDIFDLEIFNFFNAYNGHPKTFFSNILYAVAQDSEELAGKLGLVGFVTGHEVSHSLIEDPNKQDLLPVSSQKAIDCIQQQYNNTCNMFKEESCEVSDKQIDENGSDILGLQLAYQLFENHYEERKQEIYLNLFNRTITNQQLFFYGMAFSFCTGKLSKQKRNLRGEVDDHSAHNVRINAVAQHPAFKEAFQCAPDSRMMKSVEKQCFVYGGEAPENKRKKFRSMHRDFM